MKLIKIPSPPDTELWVSEEQYIEYQRKLAEVNSKVTAKMIDCNLHIVPDVPAKDTE